MWCVKTKQSSYEWGGCAVEWNGNAALMITIICQLRTLFMSTVYRILFIFFIYKHWTHLKQNAEKKSSSGRNGQVLCMVRWKKMWTSKRLKCACGQRRFIFVLCILGYDMKWMYLCLVCFYVHVYSFQFSEPIQRKLLHKQLHSCAYNSFFQFFVSWIFYMKTFFNVYFVPFCCF